MTDYKSMTNNELQNRYADVYMEIEWLRKVLALYECDDADISKKALGERLVEFAAIQLEVQMRLVSGATAGRWRTGEPEHDGLYLVDYLEIKHPQNFRTCLYEKIDGWISEYEVIRWMELPGEKYGGAE